MKLPTVLEGTVAVESLVKSSHRLNFEYSFQIIAKMDA